MAINGQLLVEDYKRSFGEQPTIDNSLLRHFEVVLVERCPCLLTRNNIKAIK